MSTKKKQQPIRKVVTPDPNISLGQQFLSLLIQLCMTVKDLVAEKIVV